MRSDPQQLERHLSNQLPHAFLIAGSEMLLRLEAAEKIRQALKQQGVTEREILEVDKNFDWQQLSSAGATLSLFGDSRLIELRLTTGKIGREGSKAVQEWLENNSGDYLLVTSEQWDLATEKSAWAKAIEQSGLYLPTWPVKPHQLPGWLKQRLSQHGLQADAEAVAMLSSRLEGNLLAAAQEVEKLALLLPPGPLTGKQVEAAVVDSAQYDVFRLAETILAGNATEALRIASGLERAGEAPPLLVGLIAREFQLLLRWMQDSPKVGADAAFRQLGIWRNRQPAIQQAARRLGKRHAALALARLGQLDRLAKGQSRGHFQTALERFIVSVTHPPQSAASHFFGG
ncbi:MAG: DNA polymerase III subunit delta [Wenzhouxiangellaceae bacterium]